MSRLSIFWEPCGKAFDEERKLYFAFIDLRRQKRIAIPLRRTKI